MSSKRFSFFKSKPKRPRPKVIVSGHEELLYPISGIFSDKIKQGKRSEISRYDFEPSIPLGGRCPERPLLERMSYGGVAFIFIFRMPLTEYYVDVFPVMIPEFNFVINTVNESGNVVLVLHDYINDDDFGQGGESAGPEYGEWVKEISEKNTVGKFDVNTATNRGVDEAFQWLKEQLLLDIKQEETIHTEKKISGFRWLGKLSKVALSFGADSS